MYRVENLKRGLGKYGRPRVLGVFFMGIASGFPLTLLLSSLGFWLIDEGISKSTIGFLSLALVPYSVKFLWAPALDSLKLSGLERRLGRRRSWLLLFQLGLGLGLFGLALISPLQDPLFFGLMALIVSFMSASQDLVIDAYRIEILDDDEMAAGAAMTHFGYRLGNLVAGVASLKLADWYGWDVAYMVMPVLLLFGLIPVLIFGEPAVQNQAFVDAETRSFRGWLAKQGQRGALFENFLVSVVLPFREFMRRPGWAAILLFILFLKLGDSMAGVMTAPLIGDLGFSKNEIILANKTVGFIALLVGAFVGGGLLNRLGTYRGLMIAAVLMMVSNLGFALLAETGRHVDMLIFVIGFENFASGMGGVIAVAYLSGLCHLAFTATQYALLSSIAALSRQIIGAPSGFMQESLGYTGFFLLTTVVAVPGLILLRYLYKRGFVSNAIRSGKI